MIPNLPENNLFIDDNTIIGFTNATNGHELTKVDSLIQQHIQTFANKIKNDVESALKKTFNFFIVTECTASCNHLHHTCYNMRINVDDSVFLQVRAVAVDPDEAWTLYIDKYEASQGQRGLRSIKKVAGSPENLIVVDKCLKNELQSLCNYMKLGVELIVGQVFTAFELVEFISVKACGVNYYHIRLLVDDNGSVKLKLTQNVGNASWNIQVQKYEKGSKKLMEEEIETSIRNIPGVQVNTMKEGQTISTGEA